MSNIAVFFIKAFSRLPFWLVYLAADLIYWGLFRGIGYRKKVVLNNLRNSFPEKSPEEIKELSHQFFRHLADLMVESLKVITANLETLNKRVVYHDTHLIDKLWNENKSIVIVLGHMANWEYVAATAGQYIKQLSLGVYKPLKNKAIETLMNDYRAKSGIELVPVQETRNTMRRYIEKGTKTALILIADQAPSPEKAYWMKFLNQDTPVFYGAEFFSRTYDHPLVFAHLEKVKRGYYRVRFETLHEHPQETYYGELTELHTKALEKDILEDPAIWLWSHKRWKHKIPADLNPKQRSSKYPVSSSE